MTHVLKVTGLRAYYRVNAFGITREVRAVDDVSLHVEANEIYGLAGESSCGKSTLAKAISGAVRPPLSIVGGSVIFDLGGRRVEMHTAGQAELDAIRWRHLSYVVQGSMNILNPVRRVKHSFIDFAFRHVGLTTSAFFDRIGAHLERLHLPASILDAYPHELSGGMRQRVTIALATICTPDFIIADEPTTALDVIVQKNVLALLREVQQVIGASLLLVTHDLTVHATLSDRLGIMYAGRLVEEGPTGELFRAPRHPYTRHLVASLPRLGDVSARASLQGRPPSLADPPPGCRFHPRCPSAMDICRSEVPVMQTLASGHRVACFAATA